MNRSVIQYMTESWNLEPTVLYIHKLNVKLTFEKNYLGIKGKKVFDNNDIYIYSFLKPSSKKLMSLTTNSLPKENKESICFPTFIHPNSPAERFNQVSLSNIDSKELTSVLKKSSFKIEQIMGQAFENTNLILKKVYEIPGEIITTHIPIPVPIGIGFGSTVVWQNVELVFDGSNKLNLKKINFKRFKLVSGFSKVYQSYSFKMITTN